jgi:hypothetical protein
MRPLNQSQNGASFFRASCTAAEAIGKMVYVSGAEVTGLKPVRLADSDDNVKMPSVGVVIHKVSAVECIVQQSGNVESIFSGLEEGKTYKIGSLGEIQRLAPSPGVNGYAMVQFVGHAISDTVLSLAPESMMAVKVA